MDENPGVLLINVQAYLYAGWYLMLAVLYEVCATIFSAKNIKISNDRVGLTRSAILLILFIVIHAVGNLHVFKGPDDFNGYGYFYVRLYWTGFGFNANIVEEYVALCALMHVVVALKRTWDISINYTVASGKLNLAFSGVALLTFMTIHLFQFRFGETTPYEICPPPYLINAAPWLALDFSHMLNLFWTPTCANKIAVRDIYKLEFDIFKDFGWCMFYISSVLIFCVHTCLGWQKVVGAPALDIPKRHQRKAAHVGYVMTAFVGLIYISFPAYTHLWPMSKGNFGAY